MRECGAGNRSAGAMIIDNRGEQRKMSTSTGKNTMTRTMSILVALTVSLTSSVQTTAQDADPLPSWNDGQVKRAIVQFVIRVTTKGGPDYVPREQRIATFDNDGTLWCEQPIIQGIYLKQKLDRMADDDQSLCQGQPFSATFENGMDSLKAKGVTAFLKLFATTHAGMTDAEFTAEVEQFFNKTKHLKFDVSIGHVVYQPMIELLEYLRANDFTTYICSGGGIDFIRVVSPKLYGIPPQQVIGSSVRKELQKVEGKWVLTRTGNLNSINDKNEKAVNIGLHIGQRPLFAMGNVRSGGDIGMLAYSQGRNGTSLQLLVNHDDEKREFGYSEKNGASLNAAKANGWTVVSMKNDWKSIFASGARLGVDDKSYFLPAE
jgi:hypothetical protein